MNISTILINHMIEPIGFQLDSLRIDFTVEADQYTEVTKQLVIWTTSYEQPIYKSDKESFETNFFDVSLDLTPRTRYHVEVSLYDSDMLLCAKESFLKLGKCLSPLKLNGSLIQIRTFKTRFSKGRSCSIEGH